ncbi:hypothetical protein HCY47_09135 [Limosilactobacillus fermentum]
MNKRQHKKWLKKYFEEVATSIEDLNLYTQDQLAIVISMYVASNDTRIMQRDVKEIADHHPILEVVYLHKEDKPAIIQGIPYVCLVAYVKTLKVVRRINNERI